MDELEARSKFMFCVCAFLPTIAEPLPVWLLNDLWTIEQSYSGNAPVQNAAALGDEEADAPGPVETEQTECPRGPLPRAGA
jgi:hypothetical protein